MRRLVGGIASVCVAAAVMAAATPGLAGTALASPKARDDAGLVKCSYSVPRSYPLSSMTRKGLPVRVTCEGDATVSSLVDMTGKVGHDWDNAHHHNIPGIALSEDTKVRAGVPAVTHARITKSAARFLQRYHSPRLRVLLGELMPRGYYQSIDSGKPVVLR